MVKKLTLWLNKYKYNCCLARIRQISTWSGNRLWFEENIIRDMVNREIDLHESSDFLLWDESSIGTLNSHWKQITLRMKMR